MRVLSEIFDAVDNGKVVTIEKGNGKVYKAERVNQHQYIITGHHGEAFNDGLPWLRKILELMEAEY